MRAKRSFLSSPARSVFLWRVRISSKLVWGSSCKKISSPFSTRTLTCSSPSLRVIILRTHRGFPTRGRSSHHRWVDRRFFVEYVGAKKKLFKRKDQWFGSGSPTRNAPLWALYRNSKLDGYNGLIWYLCLRNKFELRTCEETLFDKFLLLTKIIILN